MNVPIEVSAEASNDLLLAIAEQLKVPLLHIAQFAELAEAKPMLQVQRIENVADMALRLLDGYIFSRKLALDQLPLNMEPITVSSVLQDAAHKLTRIANDYSCELELNSGGKFGPVFTHRQSMEAAMVLLGYSFILGQQESQRNKRRVVLAAHRSRYGITSGIYGHNKGLSASMFKRARMLYGKAHNPLSAIGNGSGASVFVADKLLNSIDTRLYVSRHNKLTGLAAVFAPSFQLRLV